MQLPESRDHLIESLRDSWSRQIPLWGLPLITHGPRGIGGGVKSLIHFYCVLHATTKKGGGGGKGGGQKAYSFLIIIICIYF